MKQDKNKDIPWLGLAVVILVAGNLRSPITSVSPILSEIQEALNLSSVQGSLLTSIPLMMFASCSILVSKTVVKTNINYSLIFALLVLVAGLYFRVLGNVSMLYVGSLMLGLGICIGNVTTPAYIKNIFPQKVGFVTGIFSVAMNLLAALASGFSISIGKWTNAGWQGSLGVWIIWSVLSLLFVIADTLKTRKKQSEHAVADASKVNFNIFRSKQSWNISLFMGMQSLVYYCLVALLPTILIDYGMDKNDAGWIISIIQLAMLPVMFIGPVIAAKIQDQKLMIYSIGALMFIGLTLLAVFQTQFIYLSAILLGVSGGLAFSLSILFFSLKSRTTAGTLKVSGKAQSIGYLIAAFGPPVFGLLHNWDATWKASLYFLMIMTVVMTIVGRFAAKPRYVEEY